jgi:hypothetical protein
MDSNLRARGECIVENIHSGDVIKMGMGEKDVPKG